MKPALNRLMFTLEKGEMKRVGLRQRESTEK